MIESGHHRFWKTVFWNFPFLFRLCPFGGVHWPWERLCTCGQGQTGKAAIGDHMHKGGAYDLVEKQEVNLKIQEGDRLQPAGIGLKDPLAWRVIGFLPSKGNPKHKVIISHPISGDRLTLENNPRNTRRADSEYDPAYVQKRRAQYESNRTSSSHAIA